MKLPKQWKHWCKKARLEPESKYSKHDYIYLIGYNRRWRVNASGIFECSCPLEHFDRWVNSRGAAFDSIPTTELEFLNAVKSLIIDSKDTK